MFYSIISDTESSVVYSPDGLSSTGMGIIQEGVANTCNST